MDEQPSGAGLTMTSVVDRAADLIFKASYSPVEVADLLSSAETRSRIRRLTPHQLFFGLSKLDDQQMQQLLPQVTEEQWAAILDLSLWDRDSADTDTLLNWQRHMIEAPDAVARKLWRATSFQLWELAFSRDFKIVRWLDEDTTDGTLDDDAATLTTPDGGYSIQLPEDPRKAELWSALIVRLFRLEAEQMALILEESLLRTPIELEEEAYQERCRRLEDFGFQDYFEALDIYTPLAAGADLPAKNPDLPAQPVVLPSPLEQSSPGILFLQALARIDDQTLLQELLEEIFFVCNKVLSADRVQPDDSVRLRETIRKGLAGLNLGLSLHARDDVEAAVTTLSTRHFLSLFQLGYGHLLSLQSKARRILAVGARDDLLEQATLEAQAAAYPEQVELTKGKLILGYFWNRTDLEEAHLRLDRMRGSV